MLVLSRRTQEELLIVTPSGEEVRVRVCRIRGGKVRLGIVADRRVEVYRTETLVRPRAGGGDPVGGG